MVFKPLFGKADISSIFLKVFSDRKNSAKAFESFVGAAGQNPVFVQNRVNSRIFLKSTSKCNMSDKYDLSCGVYDDTHHTINVKKCTK